MFGVNRLKRRARRLLGKHPTEEELAIEATRFGSKRLLGDLEEQFGPLAELGDKVIGLPLLADNQIELFASSEQSATAMLSAIEELGSPFRFVPISLIAIALASDSLRRSRQRRIAALKCELSWMALVFAIRGRRSKAGLRRRVCATPFSCRT